MESHQMFRCTQCPYSSAHKVLLTNHLLTHSGERPHRCELCGKAFAQKNNLTRHLLVHSGEKPYVCDTCGKGFSFKSAFKYHKWTHSGPEPCDACGNHFGSSVDPRVLKCPRAMGRPNVCPHCHFGTRSAFGLRQHIQKVHACGKGFCEKSALRTHERTHSGPHPCDACGTQFGSSVDPSVLKCSRAMGHPNVCPHCHFGTRSLNGLRKHIRRIHTKASKHSCSFCSAIFSSPSELQRHVKKLHLVKEEKEAVDIVKKEVEGD